MVAVAAVLSIGTARWWPGALFFAHCWFMRFAAERHWLQLDAIEQRRKLEQLGGRS